MPSSNIIRGGQAEPVTFKEVGTEAVYQSDWAMLESDVIRNTSELRVYDFPLFKPGRPQTGKSTPVEGSAGHAAASSSSTDTKSLPPSTGGNEVEAAGNDSVSIQDQATRILQQAQEDADRYLDEAREKVAGLERERYEAGWSQGQQEALQDIQAQFASMLESFQKVIAEVVHLRQETLHQAEADIITLAFQLAKKIVCCEILSNRDVFATTLRRALDHAVTDDTVVVRVNPVDLEHARQLQEELLHNLGAIRQLTMQGDDTIGPGGCVVESTFGVIDARIEAQLEELGNRFREQCHITSEVNVV
jgi:flagellar biosynthesis/type III secretory pathway protein FliH